ncbi:hypothetical protein [Limnofasciculus baicalensis]|uniref:Uncharacterized protein n=1 Tax=Limnofasciculus baicalensis BBK-W-15 TaxID=2699891 RepID=A0AAE3KNI1_9CYAN|nr:hypothetical protein [Limnofasciculus baicalensis]MCP2728683.1 hypothetical protein [Limnofasciculus baicalensis BBK-W-15]
MTGTAMNIDKRKETENLLRQQSEQQRLIMDMTQRIRESLLAIAAEAFLLINWKQYLGDFSKSMLLMPAIKVVLG